MSDLKSVLVLCTGNSCRSQMAEGYFNRPGTGFRAVSAGTKPSALNADAVEVMYEDGVDISGGTSDRIDKYADESFDYVITVCDNAARECPAFPGTVRRLHWPFDDPAEAAGPDRERLEIFRRVRDEISARVAQLVSA